MRALIILAVLATPALAKMRKPDDSELSASQISDTMRSRQPAFRACFNRAIKTNPKLRARFGYTFTIEPSGRVSRAAATAGTAESAQLDKCMVSAIRKIVFPKASGSTTVTYPALPPQA